MTLVFYMFWRQYESYKVSKMEQDVLSVWAGLGPFKSGVESANAVKSAHISIYGLEIPSELQEGFIGHQAAYDLDPDGWEDIRQKYLTGNDKIKFYIMKAKAQESLRYFSKYL